MADEVSNVNTRRWEAIDFKALAWNCRGLGSLRTTRRLKELKWKHHPKQIFLSKTKKKKGGMEPIRCQLRYDNCLEVECRGLSVGLAFLWNNDFNLQIHSFSPNHIDVVINSGKCRFTGIYGFSEANRNKGMFHLLDLLRTGLGNSQPSNPSSALGISVGILNVF